MLEYKNYSFFFFISEKEKSLRHKAGRTSGSTKQGNWHSSRKTEVMSTFAVKR